MWCCLGWVSRCEPHSNPWPLSALGNSKRTPAPLLLLSGAQLAGWEEQKVGQSLLQPHCRLCLALQPQHQAQGQAPRTGAGSSPVLTPSIPGTGPGPARAPGASGNIPGHRPLHCSLLSLAEARHRIHAPKWMFFTLKSCTNILFPICGPFANSRESTLSSQRFVSKGAPRLT